MKEEKKMNYQEYCKLKEELAIAENAYLTAWKECKSKRKKGKKLSKLAYECLRLNDLIMTSEWYK